MKLFQVEKVLDTHQGEEKLNRLQRVSARGRDGRTGGKAGVEQQDSRAKAL